MIKEKNMKKIGLFYGSSTTKTTQIAQKIQKTFGDEIGEIIPVEEAWTEDFEKFNYIIVGVSTWFDGELPSYWDEIKPALESMDMKGKKIAIFGLGDQVNYSENFVDAIGLLADLFESIGAKVIGHTSTKGYTFEGSLAQRGNKFVGLAIDIENQSKLTDKRIEDWIKQLKKEFK